MPNDLWNEFPKHSKAIRITSGIGLGINPHLLRELFTFGEGALGFFAFTVGVCKESEVVWRILFQYEPRGKTALANKMPIRGKVAMVGDGDRKAELYAS